MLIDIDYHMNKAVYLYLSILSLIFACHPVSAQLNKDEGNIKTDIREIKDFQQLVLQGNFEVTIIQGELEGVRITGNENLFTLFQTRKANDVLFITMTADIKKTDRIEVAISFKQLTSITLLGNISLKTTQIVHFDELNLFSSGSSAIDAEIYSTTLNITLVDQTSATFKGFAQTLNINNHGDTDLNAFYLENEDCSVVATGYSETMVNCKGNLSLIVTGESNVYYLGEPKITNRIFSSQGFIVKRKNETSKNEQ